MPAHDQSHCPNFDTSNLMVYFPIVDGECRHRMAKYTIRY
jgi:hypothetical protein